MNPRRSLLALLIVAALLLAACGGAPAAEQPPTAQQAPTAAALPTAAPLAPTPTFEPAADAEPTVGAAPTAAPTAATAAQGGGALAWRDQVLRNDEVIVSVSGLAAPPSGQVYAAWLGGKDASLPLGPLTLSSDPATLTFVSPNNENLLGTYSQVYITQAAEAEATTNNKTVVLAAALPEKALVHIRHVLFSIGNTPNKIGFALGLRQETDELQRHAQFLNDSFKAGDFRLVKVHAEHIANIIEGSEAHDVNGDGKIQNPGDGFGLLQNGTQDGYIKGMVDHAKLAAEAPDATDAIKLHAGHVQIAGENTRVRVQDIHDRADKIAQAGGIADTQQDVLKILALAQQTIQGLDVNQDEQIGPVPGEGGVLTAYQHAQLMAGLALAPGQAQAPAAAEAQPAAQPQTVNIDIGDNTFAPNKITVPLGATVVWSHKGQRKHTVTADDNSFTSGTLEAGGSFKQTFSKAGTFPYYCEFHGGPGAAGMAGSIVVAEQSAAAQPAAAQPTAAPAAQPTAAPAPAAGANEVVIGDNTFTAKEISVPVGATVVWSHKGQRKHTVTADDNSFTSGTLGAGGSFKQTFSKAGTFAYYCEFHGGPGGAGMAGVIKVGDGGGAAAQPTAAPQPTAAQAAAPAAVTVSMKDFEFAPTEITVKAGGTITWKNDGAKPHSATASDNSFDTAIFQPGESKTVTFSKPGKFPYYCQLHGTPDGNGMVGTVIVE
ncbi:cupredoxin domain-containing protein [Kouleothrix sp.]|uniref:cupredoxin domain-containing protein n=1 Tax=Kouleothrix sp. TaxID=2779161 RepID=UPI00391DBCE9